MREARPIITLLTDFGEIDNYVGIMKGVMLGIVPQAQLVDLTHQVTPQDVRQAALDLMTATPFFPEDTVHLVVIDPGVGGARRPVAVQTPRARFVAPDNGVLSYALAQAENYTAVELANPAYRLPRASHTFHGRDVFSPAAAHLAAGVPLSELGPAIEDLVFLDMPRLIVNSDGIEAEVLSADHFGNLRTSVQLLTWEDDETLILKPLFEPTGGGESSARFLAAQVHVRVGLLCIEGISANYSAVSPGEPLAYVGSAGSLEIAINRGNAANEFSIKPGDPVSLHFVPEQSST